FVCENNFYSVYSGLEVRQPKNRAIYKMVEAMGLRTSIHDGNDALASFNALKAARERVAAGEGPEFLEFTTYRWREHCGPNWDNHIGYRTEAEFLGWQEKDPVALMEKLLVSEGAIDLDGIAGL